MALNNLGLGLIFTAKDLASQKIRGIDQAFKGLDQSVAGGTKRIAPNFKLIGGGIAAIGAGAAGLAVVDAAVESFAGFQKAMFEVGTLTNATNKEIEDLSALTLSLSSKFGRDNQESARTFYQIISAGVTDATEATNLFEVANKLAIGGVTSTTTAVDVLTSIMSAYGKETSEAGAVSDVLFKTIALGKTTASELGSTLGRVVPFAAQLGVSFEEVSATVAALAGVSGGTAEVMTGLRGIFGAFIKPTEEAKKVAERFGFTMNANTVRTLGFTGTLDLLAKVFKEDEEALGKLIGEKEALAQLLPLLGSRMGAFNKNLAEMKNASGATEAAFGRMAKSLDFGMQQLTALRKNFLTLMGQALAPIVAMVVTVGQIFFRVFNAIPKSIRTFLSIAFLATSVVLVLGGAFAILAGFLPSIIAGFALMKVAILAAMTPLLPVILPVVAVLVALAAVVGLFVFAVKKNFGGLGDFFGNIFGKIKLAFQTLVQIFTKGEISGPLLDELTKVENKGVLRFVGLVISTFARIKAFFKGVISGVKTALSGLAPAFTAIKTIVTSLVSIAEKVLGIFGVSLPTSVGGSISTFEKIGKVVGFLITAVFAPMVTVLSLISKAIGFVVGKFDAFLAKAGNFGTKIRSTFAKIPGLGQFFAAEAVTQTEVPSGQAPGPGLLVDSPSPAAAAAAGSTAAANRRTQQISDAATAGGDVNVNLRSVVEVDGEVLAEAQQAAKAKKNVISLGTPLPAPG